jgi:hypothetical protein
MAIEHTVLRFIAQAGAAKQDLHASVHATLQADAWVWHCFAHPWLAHGDMHDVRFVVHACAHAEAVAVHTMGHDASGIAVAASAAGWVWAASAWSAASAVSTAVVATAASAASGAASKSALDASVTCSAASACATLRAPSFTMSEQPVERTIRIIIGALAFTMRDRSPTT